MTIFKGEAESLECAQLIPDWFQIGFRLWFKICFWGGPGAPFVAKNKFLEIWKNAKNAENRRAERSLVLVLDLVLLLVLPLASVRSTTTVTWL